MSFLDGVKMFDNLNAEEKEKLSLFCQEKNVLAWDLIFEEWDEANSMYFLVKGNIEIYKNISWKEVILWEIKAEEILWEMAIFWTDWKRTASARAVVDSSLITILSFSIKEIAFKHPDLMAKIEMIIDERESENRKIKWVNY